MATYDLDGVRHVVFVCLGSDCRKHGADGVLANLKGEIKELGLRGQVHVVRTRCMGRCDDACNVVVTPAGPWYGGVSARSAKRIAREHLRDGVPVAELEAYDIGGAHVRKTGGGKRGKPRK
ncbi:MAG TPA: (2Fe-2S) ferredoxin domain-containing protein [Gemmatimonadales bacterium]|nr:(2Fe-2S) ferredoxin domain-containing protein [Gemmatimonadales bacterium]